MLNFGNILENENDVESSDKAIKTLDLAIRNYKKTGGRGEIDRKNLQKTQLEKKLERCKIDEKSLNERKKKNEEIKENLKLKIEEQKKLNEMLSLKAEEETKVAKKENYKIIKSNVQKSREIIDEYNNFFKDQIPTDEELNTLMEKSLFLEKYKLETNNSDKFEKEIQEIEEKISNLQNNEEVVTNEKANYVLLIASIFFLIIGILLAIQKVLIATIPAILIAFFCFGFFVKERKSVNEKIIKNKNITEEIEKINELKENLKQEEESKKSEEKIKATELDESIKLYLTRYFENIDSNYIHYIQELQLKKKDFGRQMEEYTERLKKQEEYEKENNINEYNYEIHENKSENLIENENTLKNIKNLSKQELETKIENLSNEINELNDEKNYSKNQIELLESNLDTVYDTENELEELTQTIEEMKEQCKILEETKAYLEMAKNKFSSKYLGEMEKNFTQNLNLINGENIKTSIDVNLNVQINEKGSNKELNYFSTGITDLIYICMRLSLIDTLFKEEKPFIILDDPFVNLDEKKMKNAIDLINKISEKYQVIYFICHECRS